MNIPSFVRNLPTLALGLVFASTLALTACGGGGTRAETPPPPPPQICTDPDAENTGGPLPCRYPPPPPQVCEDPDADNTGDPLPCTYPPPPPPVCEDPDADNTGDPLPCTYPPPPPPVCEDPDADNFGGPLPCIYRYNGDVDNLLVVNNVDLAHAEGFTGKGVTVGMVDVAFDYANMNYSPLDGKVLSYDTELKSFTFKEGEPDAAKLHMQFSAAHLAAQPIGEFNGGVAPDAQLRWFGICMTTHENCVYDPLKSKNYAETLLGYGDVGLISASLGNFEDLGWVLTSRAGHEFWLPLREHDALIVGSAGNSNQEQPSLMWQVPNASTEYYGHFIVAMSLHVNEPWGRGENEDVSVDPQYEIHRASYSNACGVAAQWCVGAISNAIIPRFDDPELPFWGAGTSASAPIVSGVAALVMEAYPWMSALNVQQTVLTTATDIGEPGVDPIFGWGMVNARKAVDGPAQFPVVEFDEGNRYMLCERSGHERCRLTRINEEELEQYSELPLIEYYPGVYDGHPDYDVFIAKEQWRPYYRHDTFTARIEGESRPFFNDISGDGGLLKLGSGSLTLTGYNTYTGGTRVEEGALRSTGTFGSEVKVAPGATFMTGGVGVTINGDYAAYSATDWNAGLPESEWKTGTATTAIQIGAPLTVTGEADIGDHDTRLLLLPEAESYTVNSTETLITTGKGLFGQFGEVSYGSGFFWNARLNYGPRILTTDLTRTSAQAQAMSLGAPTKVVDGAGMADTLITHTDMLVESGQTAGSEALLSATAKLMSASTDEAAMLSLSSLTGEIHGAARALGIRRALDGGERLADRLRTLGRRQPTGVWIQGGSGKGQNRRMGYGEAEVHHSTYGIGADTRVGEVWTLGISAARTRSNAHLDIFGGRLTGSGQQMAVYARRDLGPHGYLSSLASYDRHTVDTQRRVLAGADINSVTGQHTDSATLVRLETGLRFSTGLAPYLAAGTLSLRQGGFTEAGVLGLSAGTDTFTAAFAEFGTRFDRHFVRWSFAGTVSARRMSGGEGGFNAAFAGAETAKFTVAGQPLTRSSIRLGSDIGYRTRNGWQLSLGLGADQGSGQRRNGWGEVSARVGF